MNKKSKIQDSVEQGYLQAQGVWNQMQGEALNKALSDYSKGIK